MFQYTKMALLIAPLIGLAGCQKASISLQSDTAATNIDQTTPLNASSPNTPISDNNVSAIKSAADTKSNTQAMNTESHSVEIAQTTTDYFQRVGLPKYASLFPIKKITLEAELVPTGFLSVTGLVLGHEAKCTSDVSYVFSISQAADLNLILARDEQHILVEATSDENNSVALTTYPLNTVSVKLELNYPEDSALIEKFRGSGTIDFDLSADVTRASVRCFGGNQYTRTRSLVSGFIKISYDLQD